MEVTLALAISVMLLAALYWAFFTLIRQTMSGRETIERSNVRRAVFRRFTEDIGNHLAPFDPRVSQPTASGAGGSGGMGSGSSGSGSGSSNTGTTGTSNTSTTTTTAPGGSAAPSTSGAGTASSGANGSTDSEAGGVVQTSVLFNMGVVGDANHLMLFISGVPGQGRSPIGTPPGPSSDLWRVCYWLAPGPGVPLGLARKEYRLATADEALNHIPWEDTSQPFELIAREVHGLEFEYYDADTQSWVTQWDGTAVGADGQTPLGPPAAIRISIMVANPTAAPNDPRGMRLYHHVVQIPTANGMAVAVPSEDMMNAQ
jgi:hypothetical protein